MQAANRAERTGRDFGEIASKVHRGVRYRRRPGFHMIPISSPPPSNVRKVGFIDLMIFTRLKQRERLYG